MSSEKKISRTSLLWNVLKIILAVALAGFVLSKTDFNGLFALRNQILYGWLITVFLLFISLTLLKSMQYYFLIGRQVSYSQVLNVIIVQNAVSNFIATSAGVASYLTLFRAEQGVKLSRATLAFILAKVGDLIAIWLFLILAALSVWPSIQIFHGVVIFILGGIGLALVLFFVAIVFRQNFVILLVGILNYLNLTRIGMVSRFVSMIETLVQQEKSFVFRTIGMAILFSIFYMLVTMAWMYASLRTFSLEIGVMPTVFVNTLLQLISYLPIQIFGGLGLTETSMLYFYGPFDLPQSQLAAILVANRLLFYITNLLVLLYLPVSTVLQGRSSKP
jgi:uncharacterized protein (TIRG00374 family)